MTSQGKDDDFAGMLQRVRAASGADTPSPPGSREPPPEKKGPEGSSFVSWFGLIAIATVLVAGVIGLASLSTWIARRMVAQGASADLPTLRARQLQQQRFQRYVVAVDTTISPVEAGRLLHAIGNAGFTGPLRPWEQEPVPTFAAPCCPQWAREASQLFGPNRNTAIFSAARRGLTTEQRALLRNVARNPSLEAFRRAAHARAADVGGAMWSVPADTQVSWGELPTMRHLGLRQAADASAAAAALDLADGRTTSAELRLREVISVGFLIQKNARFPVDEAVAGGLVNSGRVWLEALYLAVGRVDDASFASAKSDPPMPVSHANRRVRAGELEATLLRRIRDTTELTGIRWQLLLGPFAYLPCTSVRRALFGPSARYRAALAEFRGALVKYPSDERRLTMVVRGVPQMIDPWVGFRQRNTGRPAWADFASTVTRSGQLERCATLFRR